MDQDIYIDALLAQISDSVVRIAFQLAEVVEILKGDGQDSVAQNPAVKALVHRLAWLTGTTRIDAYYAALDECLEQLDDDNQRAVVESIQTDAARRILRLG
jgi:hypothetical protein